MYMSHMAVPMMAHGHFAMCQDVVIGRAQGRKGFHALSPCFAYFTSLTK